MKGDAMVFEYRGNTRTPGLLGQVPGALGGRVPGPLRSGPKDESGKGNTATKASKTTPDQAAGTSDALNAKAAKEALGYVGKPVVGRGECFDLVDAIARNTGAKSASGFDKITGSRDQNYRWGAEVPLKDVKVGDSLQFRDHKIVIETTITVTKDGKVIEKSPSPSREVHNRAPQHSAIVVSINPDGSLDVVEQHVIDPKNPDKLSGLVRRNTLYIKNQTMQDKKTKTENDHQIVTTIEKKITVSGKVWVYHPQENPEQKKDLDFR
jgi:hypothetical protein